MSRLIQKVCNPQGKGLVGVTEDLRTFSPMHVEAKSSLQWLADYFTSTLVLGAKFGFKPVVGNQYYLYFKNQHWKLSLIEPHAWRAHDPGIFFAQCVLNKDMSWCVVPDQDWKNNEPLAKVVTELEQTFIQSLNDTTPVVENLPFYIQHLSYYQRIGANALARSLKQSLEIKLGKDKSLSLSGVSIMIELRSSEIRLLEAGM